ncbi:phage portal protein [Lentzea sp. JNUCC 0626]|uniref:phage portal protein n=1 Tax=Lentzea sp. JNUCC 0626 TaxID=3367513 RepID=UPI003748B5A2
MALSKFETDTINRLASQLRRDSVKLNRYGDYYEGLQALENLGIAIPPDLRQFVVMVNWPRIVADSLEERIDAEGFRLPGKHERDENLWHVWQANNLDEESQLGHLDAIVFGRSYICIGTNEDDENTPLVTVESPLEMTAEISPRTRKVTAALRLYRDKDDDGRVVDKATLYLPKVTIWAERRWTGPSRGWVEVERDEHNLGQVPVVPLVNRPRIGDRYGVSELQDVIDLTDAAARALTLAQLATEALSVPQRAVLGASEEDFVGPDGKILPKWAAYFGAIWALENPEAKLHQFSAADLGNFKTIVDHYASMVSSVTGLPLRFFGQNTANPPSAEGIRADEARIVKRAERRQRAWGGSWEEAMRIVKRFQTGEWDDTLKELETIWRDPATPTRAQQADAAVKLVQANILPVEAAWEEMGYSQTRIKALKKMRDDQLAATDVLARQINAYRQGVTEDPGANEGIEDPEPDASATE